MVEAGRHYSLCGWRVASAITLPELPSWPDEPGDPDIVIALGEVPERLADPLLATPFLQIASDGRTRYTIPGVADFLIEHGARVTVASSMAPDSPDVRLFLLGSVFGILCNQRGVLPLHACTVEIDGGAVSFAGASGMGKSTLAAAFHRRGFRLLSDDVTPIDFSTGTVRFLPGLRRIRLWADSVEAAGWDPGGLERCRDGLEKFSRAFDEGFVTAPLAPLALFHLRRQPQGARAAEVERLQGMAAVDQLRRQVYRWRQLHTLVGGTEAMARVVRSAKGIPRHFELKRCAEYGALDPTIDAVLDVVRYAQ